METKARHEATKAERRMARLYPKEDIAAARDWIRGALYAGVKSEISHLSMSEWAEKKRSLPPGLSPIPGPWRWSNAPYLKEIADCLSSTSPVQQVFVMKGAQVGFTVGILENWIGYTIDEDPGPMMFVSADADVAEESVELRVDRMIESAGLMPKIFSQSKQGNGKKTGDTKKKKEFPGWFLLAVGPNSGGKLRSFSIQKLLEDEMDAFPQQIGGADGTTKRAAEGDPHTILRRRLDAYEMTSKNLGGSTPLVEQTSRIKKLFDAGDQRRYFVPCKHCGAMQPLEWRDKATGAYRMIYDKDEAGNLIWSSVRYECAVCGKPWKNEDKAWFLPRGEWRPTAVASQPNYRSYHLPALLSPVWARSWESICQEWIAATEDQGRLRAFINTVLGEPFQESGEAPRYEKIMLRREDWSAEAVRFDEAGHLMEMVPAVIPDTAKVITIGADVQKDRIECEVVAWGEGKESWSIGYHVLPGETADISSPAWRQFAEILSMPHGGLPISLALIDSHYQTPTVYSFSEGYELGVMPCMGESHTIRSAKVFKIQDVAGYLCRRADIYTDVLKIEIYQAIAKSVPDSGMVPVGYCHFPGDRPESYFRMLVAEERVSERTRTGQTRYVWKKPEGRRNEALDCRVYALAALYIVASEVAPVDEHGAVSWADFWQYMNTI